MLSGQGQFEPESVQGRRHCGQDLPGQDLQTGLAHFVRVQVQVDPAVREAYLGTAAAA